MRCHLSGCDVEQPTYHFGYTVCEPAACMCAGILMSEQVHARPGWVRARHARRVCDAHSSSSRESCAHRMPTALRSGVAPEQTIGVALPVDSHVSFTHAALQCRHRPPGCCDGRRALDARFWQQSALCTTASATFQCRPRARYMASTRRDAGHCRCMASPKICVHAKCGAAVHGLCTQRAITFAIGAGGGGR